jgi:hypothetical protein
LTHEEIIASDENAHQQLFDSNLFYQADFAGTEVFRINRSAEYVIVRARTEKNTHEYTLHTTTYYYNKNTYNNGNSKDLFPSARVTN